MAQVCYLRLYLASESVSCRLVQRNCWDGNEFKLEEAGPSFSSFNAMSVHGSTGAFRVRGKRTN